MGKQNKLVNCTERRKASQRGQSVVLLVLAVSVFLMLALGLAIDGSQLYAQRQMAQAAADSAAQAGIVTIFNGGTAIGTSAYFCTSSNTTSPCTYVANNGYTAGTCTALSNASVGADCIKVDPNPGVSVSGLDSGTPNELQVTVTRAVPMTLMKLAGLASLNVTAQATAAIVDVTSPVPILITHPTLQNALNMNGTTGITIIGGPQRSIEINSNNTTAFAPPSSGSVDLSKAGPAGTGGNFGVFGGPRSKPGSVNVGTTGSYISPADPIQDPLAGIAAPAKPGGASLPKGGSSCTHCSNCPNGSSCQEYSPGFYGSGIDTTGKDAIFDPGIYYETGGFTTKNSNVAMCTSCTQDATTKGGMLVYDTGAASGGCDATGGFTIDTNSSDVFYGAGVDASNPLGSPVAPYYGILFFEDRNACAQSHTLGQGNGCFSIIGTVYITNTLAIMTAKPTQYQSVTYHGTPCSSQINYGEIIVSELTVKGASGIHMTLFPQSLFKVRQIALVNGE